MRHWAKIAARTAALCRLPDAPSTFEPDLSDGLLTADMEADLQSLEERVALLVKECRRLRAENIDLRQTMLVLEADNKRLNDKVGTAIARVDALIGQLPDDSAAEAAEDAA